MKKYASSCKAIGLPILTIVFIVILSQHNLQELLIWASNAIERKTIANSTTPASINSDFVCRH